MPTTPPPPRQQAPTPAFPASTDQVSANDARGIGLSRPAEWRTAKWIAVAALLLYLIITGTVTGALRYSGVVARGNETTFDRAVFTSLNAATLTGFQQTMGVREMSSTGWVGPALLLMLTFVGTLMTLIVGGLAAARALRMPYGAGQILWAAGSAVLLATLSGAAVLAASGHPVHEAVFQSASAFSNSGLWLGEAPSTTAAITYLVLLPLAVLGGLGLPVLIEISHRAFGGPALSQHSLVVLRLTGALYLAGLLALILAQVPAALGGGWPAWRSTLASCSVASINARTAGIPFQSPAAFTPAGQWVLIALMLLGAAPAGLAGGLKITTLWQLVRAARGALAGRVVSRAAGIAATWLAIYLATMFIGVLFLVSTEPQLPGDRLLFLAVSALSNVGLAHDPVSITGTGLLVLSALMLIGRLAPLGILWWLASTTSDVDVLVG